MIIRNNLASMTAYNSIESVNKSLQKSIQKLSTGLRLNSSSDDAAGFAIANKMRSQIFSLDRAMQNSRDGISLLNTAEGALNNINSMLQRIRELSVQASNDTLTSQERMQIQLEINELRNNINRISNNTTFNNKRLLDGSSGANWSSSDKDLSVIINGGLTSTDEFGNEISSEGNYRIEITSQPGQSQIQKSKIIEYQTEIQNVKIGTITEKPFPEIGNIKQYRTINLNNLTEGDKGKNWSFINGCLTLQSGNFKIEGNENTPTENRIVISPGSKASVILSNVNIDVSNTKEACAFDTTNSKTDIFLSGSNSLLSGEGRAGLEITKGSEVTINSTDGYNELTGNLTAKGAGGAAGIGGAGTPYSREGFSGKITINGGTVNSTGGTYTANAAFSGAGIGSGAYNHTNNPVTPDISDVTSEITIMGGKITSKGGAHAAGIGGGWNNHSGKIQINNNAKNNLLATWGCGAAQHIGYGHPAVAGTLVSDVSYFDYEYTPPETEEFFDNIESPLPLSQSKSFYNSEGVSLIAPSKTISITQGDGKSTEVTIYPEDTIYDVADKINNAISNDLGQGVYTNNQNNFCTVSGDNKNYYSKEPIYSDEIYLRDENGEIVLDDKNNPIEIPEDERIIGYKINSDISINSAIPGKEGELIFSGDTDFLNALGLNTTQESEENIFSASVYDAHSGKVIAQNVESNERKFPSLIPPEIDIKVDHMTGLSASWDESTRKFMFAQSKVYNAMIHLKNNGVVFQIGANQGEDFSIQLGSSSAKALDIENINVLTRESASHAISIIDKAINKISTQRAKIGSYENSLEYTIDNIETETLNLTSAESRIKDVDMAKEMMRFVKYQILNQSGNSMLSQANQLPNSVLSLLGN